MHESGVAERILEIAAAHSRGRDLESLRVGIGTISGVAKDPLDFWLRVHLEEKGFSGTRVEYDDIPVKMRCRCGSDYEVEDMGQPCPSCGGYDRTILQGQECTLESIEVNDGPNPAN